MGSGTKIKRGGVRLRGGANEGVGRGSGNRALACWEALSPISITAKIEINLLIHSLVGKLSHNLSLKALMESGHWVLVSPGGMTDSLFVLCTIL